MFDFIPDKHQELLEDRFESLKEFADASVEDIASLEGIGKILAAKYAASAKEAYKIAEKAKKEFKLFINIDEKAKFDNISEDNTKYVLREIKADSYTIVRKRIKVAPNICRQCGFDILAFNNIGKEYESLQDFEKLAVKDGMGRHEQTHSISERQILTGSEMATISNL